MTAAAQTPATLQLCLFGPFAALIAGRPIPRLRSRKAQWLLALLALRHERPVEREWLAGTLWPDVDQSQAYANLRPVLSELRAALDGESGRVQSPDRHTLRLDLDGADVDLVAFDLAVADGSAPALERAVTLYRGPLLEGCAEEWVDQDRSAREQACLRALGILGDKALAAGDHATAASRFRRAAGLDPWSDHVRRGWMEALSKAGDTNAALQVYRDYVQFLSVDPRAAPDEDTSALYARLRAGARERAAVHAVVSTPTAREPVPGRLPSPLTELVGRAGEITEVAAKLRRSRLVTLTGAGGVGKTRLAIAVGAETAQDYPDGVSLVPLETLSDGALIPGQVAAVLDIKEAVGRPLVGTLGAAINPRRTLLILDNCEHLLDSCAHIVGALLSECPGLRVLATSREPLGIAGEVAWSVPSLATPEPQGTAAAALATTVPAAPHAEPHVSPEELLRYDAARLFVDRAQEARKDFELTSANSSAVATICYRLEGMPLAIELAAARVRTMPVEDIADRLDDQLRLLYPGSRTAKPRQQTLRSTLDWSHDLLTEPERALFRRLSAFAGSWTADAATAVCAGEGVGPHDALDLLSSLVDKSMVVYAGQGTSGNRYRLLEMVRQYAADRLQMSGETSATRTRHRDWYLALAETAEPLLAGPDRALWQARLDSDWENLRAALSWSQNNEPGEDNGEPLLRLAGALWRYWEARGRYGEGRAHLAAALDRSAGIRSVRRAQVLNWAGVLANHQGDTVAARRLHEESLAMARELGERRAMAWPLNHLGLLARQRGDYAAAWALHQESLAIWRELGDSRGIGWSLHQVGCIAREQGEYAASRALCEESLAISRELGDGHGVAWSLNDLGNLACDIADYRAAAEYHEESLAISRELDDSQGAAWSLMHLGRAVADGGDLSAARSHFEAALPVFRAAGTKQGVALTLHYLAGVVAALGDLDRAMVHQQESLALQREQDHQVGIAWSLEGLGRLELAIGNTRAAEALFEESRQLHARLGVRRGIAASVEGLAASAQALAEPASAVRFWAAAAAIREAIGAPAPPAEAARHASGKSAARNALGPEAFNTLWAEGRATIADAASNVIAAAMIVA